jgi:hypothetical protein
MPAPSSPSEQLGFSHRLRQVATDSDRELVGLSDARLRRRPGPGEWSAIEVAGHLVDKLEFWAERVERISREERPFLPGYDQDAVVRERGYADAALTTILERLHRAAERFAVVVESLSAGALDWVGIHGENGPMTARQCIEAPLASIPGHLDQLRAASSSLTIDP